MSNGAKPPVSRSVRSLGFAAAGAIIGLLIAGVGLFTAHGTRTAGMPPEDAAVVNGVPILMADYVAQLSALYDRPLAQATAVQKRRALDDMIREELYVQRGIELGLANDDTDVRTALVRSTEGQTAADARATEPTDAEMRAWYAAHPDRYASEGVMRLIDYRLANPGEVEAVTRRLAGGETAIPGLTATGLFDADETYYFVVRLRLGDDALSRLRHVPPGVVSPPISRPDGIHLVRVLANRAPVPDSFDVSRPKIVEDWTDDKVTRLKAANDKFLRKRADIKIAVDLS